MKELAMCGFRIMVGLFELSMLLAPRVALADDSSGQASYLADCARCHGSDGKGRVAPMRSVPGYISVDLTQLSSKNGGKFPRQEVLDAIEGSKRFPAHLIGDMPVWGRVYLESQPAAAAGDKVKEKISALADYIETLQEK